ncbi:MAG: NAD(P)(+) transhydrogenase (Re/Si-specific) subunit beta [Paludibacteraceae bacterium]|nr:NAD(P)(+) transhydrogenase (Re/Si-specific) subunit beta [Paludibacteraceae bacterium]
MTLQIIISTLLSLAVLAGIAMMSRVKTSVWGNLLSALAMLCGVTATLCFNGILTVWTVFAALIAGALIGSLMASRAQMIQMPQLVALFNGLGGGASALVGVMTYMGWGMPEEVAYPMFVRFTAMLAIGIGMTTLIGSLVAAGKLHRVLNQRPVVYPAHSLLSLIALIGTAACIAAGTAVESDIWIMLGALVLSGLFGWLFAIRVGGADMPITISLLNSLSGVAGAIAGMAVGDVFLVAVGGIVGASGLLLTQIMCRAMNRSLMSILIGAKPKARSAAAPPKKQETLGPQGQTVFSETTDFEKLLEQLNDMEVKDLLNAIEALTKEIAGLREQLAQQGNTPQAAAPAEEKTPASVLKAAKNVIIVPGYGMALAQAQHMVKQLADRLEMNGAQVRFAIHPVAGRMPGHMNVLLAEADIPYEKLYEMEAINDDFKKTDAVVVIGANDVLNPAARHAEGTPIYGMPVLNVDEAPEVIVCNYDLKPGYAGVENPIYKREKGVYLCLGDAKETLMKIITAL